MGHHDRPEFVSFVDRPVSAPPDSWVATKSPAFLDWSYRNSPWRPRETLVADGSRERSVTRSTEPSTREPSSARMSRRTHITCRTPGSPELCSTVLERPKTTCGSHHDGRSPWAKRRPSPRGDAEDLTAMLQAAVTTTRAETAEPLCPEGSLESSRLPAQKRRSPGAKRRHSPQRDADDLTGVLQAAASTSRQEAELSFPEQPSLPSVLWSATMEPLCSEAALENSRICMQKRIEDHACSLQASRELGAAADAIGARARGDVTMAIRAKAVCRLATSAASRRLMHRIEDRSCTPLAVEKTPRLWAEEAQGVPPDAQEAWGEPSEGPAPRGPAAAERRPRPGEPPGSPGPASELAGAWPERPRAIRVPRNTTLGRMVQRDPARAAKYDLVAVSPWYRNKPWPPPPVKPQRRVPGPSPPLGDWGRAQASPPKSDARRDSEEPHSPSKWNQMRAVTRLVGLCSAVQGRDRVQRPDLTRLVSSHSTKDDVELEIDVWNLKNTLTIEQEEEYAAIFERFSACSGQTAHQLTRQGLQRVMREAGLMASCAAEQNKIKKVQAQVLEFCRGKDGLENEMNPLTHAKGVWELEEFLLMVAGMHQLDRQERQKANKAIADELGLSSEAFEGFRNVFDEADCEKAGSISIPELQKLLAHADVHPSEKELKLLMRRNSIGEQLSFPEFLQVMTKLEEFFVRPAGGRSAKGGQQAGK